MRKEKIMNELTLMQAMDESLLAILKAICIITIPVLITGVVISILQAATQVNEMTVTFIPKLIVMFVILLCLLPWLYAHLISMTEQFIINIPEFLR